MTDLDAPIALRRTRRSNVGIVKQEEAVPSLPPPKTPRRARKAVRFSDPGVSSGLTPMIRRTGINTPRQQRRASAPARFSRASTPGLPTAAVHSYDHHAEPSYLHHTIDGRVERRVRRNNLRDLLNKLEQQKRQNAQQAQSQISHLKSEIKSKDREIYELQNATVVIDTERIWDLEQQIEGLKEELAKRPDTPKDHSRSYNWTLAARDPFADEYTDMMVEDEPFGDATMAQFVTGTPSRARSSFPTPPATSPLLPATPCSRMGMGMDMPTPTMSSHAGVQACFLDPAKQKLEDELSSLQLEVGKLTTTLDSYKNLGARLKEQLASVTSLSPLGSDPSTADILESKVAALLQNMSDRTAAVAQLSASISDLGFPGTDTGEMITAIASGFRAARLELEYLTPGEITLPLTSHGAEVLDLLLVRLRELAKKIREDESCIDEYHDIEQSLRKQLDARVSVMDALKAEMGKAERLLNEKNLKVQELEVGNDRLKGAVDGYIRDISELEKLVERMEQQHREENATHAAQTEFSRQEVSKRDASIITLEEKLADAVRQTVNLQKEISDVQDNTTRHVVSLNKRHGNALALRDARVLELRGEIDRVNNSLRCAHETIRVLRVDKGGLQTQIGQEREKAQAAMDSMKAELQRVLQMSQDFLRSPKRAKKRADRQDEMEDELASSPAPARGGGGAGTGIDTGTGTNPEKKLRRRYDSGLGLLEEDEVEMF
ncbi:hypothetical protein QQS21_008644 [Conoideocrella luteorostrata]|uniref:Uncharacterized protein n=1 Tax=Conoideocrella luteorostrata TaxID=1105319 RepID=A0AAJ0FYH6_9HYPO|nr:hypothetical protein QQS21_008644 [Conoideocrella luteorostrata]